MLRIFQVLMLLAASVGWAQTEADSWDGPTTGPKAAIAKTVYFLASDFGNGGVAAYFRAVQTAANAIGWQLRSADGKGDPTILRTAFLEAVAAHPDAIVLGGFQPEEVQTVVDRARELKIILLGWHAASEPGPTKNLFVNIATDSTVVAEMAARFVVNQSKEGGGVVIFNDNRFDVANAKTAAMEKVIQRSQNCKVLCVENIAIHNAAAEVPKAVVRLNARFGERWKYTLAINDVYFDKMNYPLLEAGRRDIINVSAGDGSNNAIDRIRSGTSQQKASIAEPLTLQGWQSVDELNRAFSGRPPSGYISKPVLLTTQSLRDSSKQAQLEAEARRTYLSIWGQGSNS